MGFLIYCIQDLKPVTDNKKDLLERSYRCFIASNGDATEDGRIARMMNGEVVTDSESDADALECGNSVLSDRVKQTIVKHRAAIKRQNQRHKAKLLAEQCFLSRKVTKNVRGILLDYPNIGKEIETFVSERNVGADCWRRTGVLTFDGNRKIKEKVTYERIRQHLQKL